LGRRRSLEAGSRKQQAESERDMVKGVPSHQNRSFTPT
jgi:hypothetical protein